MRRGQVLAEKGRDGPRLDSQEAELAGFPMEWMWGESELRVTPGSES